MVAVSFVGFSKDGMKEFSKYGAMKEFLCCKPGYGSCPGAIPRSLATKNSPAGLIGTWTLGASSIWTQRVRMEATIQALKGRLGRVICRAGLEDDAPYAVAIAASVLSTLVLPVDTETEEGHQTVSPLGGDDVRFAAMGIISFIPLFNWLVWVFAWLDTRKKWYLVYAVVYIAPYLRSGLSLSPDDSWVPIASVLACIFHVQIFIQQRDPDPR